MAQNWYVIRTEPKGEHVASAELERAGYEVFLPLVTSVQPRSGSAEVPLFPGYLFFRCDLDRDAPTLKEVAPHVAGWVRFGGVAPSLPNDFIEALQRRLRNISHHGGLWHQFRQGEKVFVTAGHLQGFAEVMKESKSPKAKVDVLMEFMGRLVPAQVPWGNLRPAEEEHRPTERCPRRTRGRGRWIQGFGARRLAVN